MKAFVKTWNIISTILVVIVVIAAALLVGARLFGLQVFAILSGSMEPTYHVGAVIYVKQASEGDIAVGDALTFMLDEDTVVTHRVIEVVQDDNGTSYRTQGDANETPDGSLVNYKNVIGKPVFTIPYLGYVASYVQSPPGMYVAIAACAVILILAFLPDVFAPDEKKEKKNASTPE